MEPKFQSSFIPKGPLATSGTATKVSRQSDKSLLATLAVFIFVLSVLLSLGGFGYEWYLKKSLVEMSGSLKEAEASLDPDTINEISNLDQRIISTKNIIDNHKIISPFFSYLEASTVSLVRFTEFRYESINSELSLSVRGESKGYSALALQSQIFNTSKYIKDVIFGDLSLNEKGDVNFSFKAKLDPSIISYSSGEKATESSQPTQ